MFALAGADAEKARRILDWPLREVLMSFLCFLKQEAKESHALNLQLWAAKTAFAGKVKPPEVPPLLK